ncbi:MAG: hypothetical protein IPM97_05205 [Bdellovibrionaceae bacterium]|nr:hypothetical protein [Pseudobdellovibrionaceae bacterium]
MKNELNKITYILTAMVCLGVSSSNQANAGVGHGGGGEWHVIKCEAGIKSGEKLSLTVCLTGDTDPQGRYEIIPCDRDDSPYVTIQHSTGVAADARMLETTKIPGRLFSVDWTEMKFVLKMKDPIAGELILTRSGPVNQGNGTTLILNLRSMKYSLKRVSCEFGSN